MRYYFFTLFVLAFSLDGMESADPPIHRTIGHVHRYETDDGTMYNTQYVDEATLIRWEGHQDKEGNVRCSMIHRYFPRHFIYPP